MVFNKLILFIKVFGILLLFTISNLNASVVYNKDKILITDIDIKLYREIFKKNDIQENDSKVIKQIVFIKKIIEKIKKNNKEVISNIDLELSKKKLVKDDLLLDFNRFLFIKNDLIRNYYQNEISLKDINNALIYIDNAAVPISDNNCLLITKVIEIKEINNFEEIIFKRIKKTENNSYINYDNKDYVICFNELLNKKIENSLIMSIDEQVNIKLNKILYE